MKHTEEVALAPAQLFSTNAVMSIPPGQLNDEELITVWSMLDLVDKSLVQDRKTELREEMFKRAKEKGEKNDKGSFLWKLKDGKITRQRTVRKGVAEPALVKAKFGNDDVVKRTLSTQLVLTNDEVMSLAAILATSDHPESEQFLDKLNTSPVVVDNKMFAAIVESGYLTKKEAASVMTEDKETFTLRVSKPSTIKPVKAEIDRAKKRRKELTDGG
jgi:hypothetical protein